MYTNYYYPISATSLASIFGSACIYPAALYENRVNDVQSRLDEVILLTSNLGCQESDCCLEVFLTDEEKDFLLDLKNGFFIYEKPIPISRIKKIHFKKSAQVDRTITSIRMSTAFIPEAIVDHGDNNFSNESATIASLPEDFGTNLPALKNQQDEFNRILGALALMRVAHVEECNVSPHYIDTLSFFNKEIADIKAQQGCIDNSLTYVFNNPKNAMRNVVSELLMEETARKENQQIIKNKITKIIDFSNLEKNTYLYAVLYTYGAENESKRKRIDELILDHFQQIKEGKEEKVAFYYGYNRGYSILGNAYQNDRGKVNVKFPMESLLDYYIIESVFNYVVFQRVSDSFDCFNWVARKHNTARKGEYIVVDTLIRDKKKIALFSEEWWKQYLPTFLKKDDITIFGLDLTSAFMDKFIKPWTDFIKKEVQEQFDDDKQLLSEKFAEESRKLKESLSAASSDNENLQKEINDRDEYIKKIEAQNEELKKSLDSEKESPVEEETTTETLPEQDSVNNDLTASSDSVSEGAVSDTDIKHENEDAGEKSSNETEEEQHDDECPTKEFSYTEKKELVITAVEYASMKVSDLKNLAKEKGIVLQKNAKQKDIIIQLLLEPKSNDLFNQE